MLQVALHLLLYCLATAQYSIQLARQSCLIAKMTHLSKQNLESPYCIQCLDGLKDISYFEVPKEKLKGLALYSQKQKTIFLGFRGIKEVKNWGTNSKKKAKKYEQCSNCSIHNGLSKTASLLYPEVAKAVNNLVQIHGPAPIVMTGHGLGGVLAALVGLQLIQKLQINTTFTLYSFGAPRIGNNEFGEYANRLFKESYRVVYKRDAVPHLPPKFKGYSHFGTEIWYQFNNQYKTCTGDKKEKCSNSVYLMLLKKTDHKLENYLKLYNEQDKGKLLASLTVNSQEVDGLSGFEMLPIIKELEMPEQGPDQKLEFAN